jgi:type IV pilus assembly protein PilC
MQQHAGVDVSQALNTSAPICDFAEGRRCFEEASKRVAKGGGIEHSLDALRPLLSDGERAVLAAGWNSGRTEEVMDAVIAQRELWLQARTKIRSGMALPVIVLVMASFIAPLPNFIANGGALEYLISAAIPLGIAFLAWRFLSSRLENRTGSLDRTLLDLPIVGEFEKQRSISEFASLLSLLLSAGISISQALKICGCAVVNSVYREEIRRLEAVVSKGNPLSSAMHAGKLWPPEYIASIVTGEKSGRLDDVLARLGANARERYIAAVDALVQWLPKIAYGIVALFIIVQIARLVGSLAVHYQ